MIDRVQINLRLDGKQELLETIKKVAAAEGLSPHAWVVKTLEQATVNPTLQSQPIAQSPTIPDREPILDRNLDIMLDTKLVAKFAALEEPLWEIENLSNNGDESLRQELEAEICRLVAQFTNAEWEKLIELRTQSQPLWEKITPEDAQKMRDIALVWWRQLYPDQMGELFEEMYGRQEPGTKYTVATITKWLQGEVVEVRDRITQLIRLRES
ncbi:MULTISPECIES: hypothetical protein [unclassified Microcoleus]|uniref:hypothetical protein n=1 Tax=unclassified Microcoleus TaxID=2642155 RepID=UPI002FD2F36F